MAARLYGPQGVEMAYEWTGPVTRGEFVWSQMMPVSDGIVYHQSVQVYNYKCLEGLCPSKLQSLFEYNHDVYNQNTRYVYNNNCL